MSSTILGSDKHLNSVKFILVFFVVLAHTTQYNMHEDGLKYFLFTFLSIFTMPFFIMISGYSSRKINWKKWKRSALALLLTYFAFQLTYSYPGIFEALFGLKVPEVMGNFTLFKFFFIPMGPLWYIVGLIVWRLFACIIVRFRISFIWSFSISLAIAMGMGFLDTIIPSSRIITFFPFFVIGFFCPKDFFEKVSSIKHIKIYSFIVLTITAVLVALYAKQEYFITLFGEALFSGYSSITSGVLHRLLFFPAALITSICVLCLIPDTFHTWGAKSLAIYLLHPLILYPIYYGIIFTFDIKVLNFLEIPIAFIITMICVYLSRFKIIKYYLNPLMLIKK